MNFDALKTDLHNEEQQGRLAILSCTTEDILTDDFEEDRDISYHIVEPTAEWISSRIWWASSIKGDTQKWSDTIGELLAGMVDMQDMLICLNRIIITSESDEDYEAIMAFMDCDDDGNFFGALGMKWHYKSSVIINLECIKKVVNEDCSMHDEEWYYATALRNAFLVTLYHELRHLGLECNPFLPEEDYPDYLILEDRVEDWANDVFAKYHILGGGKQHEEILH